MQKSVAKVKTMRGSMSVKAGPLTEKGTFAGKLSDGETSAFNMKMTFGGNGQSMKMHMLMVGGKSYLGPAALLKQLQIDTGGKPWVQLKASSSNPVLSQMAAQMDQAKSQTGPQQYATMVNSATHLKKVGSSKVGDVHATHYRLTVNVAKLAAAGATDTTAAQAAKKAGLKDIPLDIWLDGKNRPVKVVEKFSVMGQNIKVVVRMEKYNKPVTITAPPAKDVYQG